MTIAEIISYAKNIGVDVLDAELLLADTLELQQSYVLAHPELTLTQEQEVKVITLLNRRADQEPLAYLTKSKEFFGLNLFVDNHVLVPRPESEEAISWILEKAKTHHFQHIVDIGTGSGSLILALAFHLKKVDCIAIDTKEKILDVARKNAKDLNIQNVEFIKSDLLENIPKTEKFDGIIANLPYLNPEWQRDPSTKHEPDEALYATENGLALYNLLLEQLPDHFQDKVFGIFEADPRNTEELFHITKEKLPNFHIELLNDLASLPRFVTFEK